MSNSPLNMKYIKEVKPGTYRISIRSGKSLDGKNLFVTKQVSNVTLKQAQKIRDEMWKNLDEKVGIDGNVKVIDFARFYLQNHAYNAHTGATFDGEESKIRLHIIPYIGNYKMKELTPVIVQKLVNFLKEKDSYQHNSDGSTKKLSPTTIRNVFNILSGICTYAVGMKILKENPCESVTLPKKIKYTPVVYTVDEINDLIKKIKESNLSIQKQCIFILAMSLGLRRAEIAGLTYENVDLNNRVVYIKETLSKTKSKGELMKGPKSSAGVRAVGLNDIALEMLQLHIEEQEKMKNQFGNSWVDVPNIFTDGPNGTISPNAITDSWRRFLLNHKLKYVPLKGLRTSFATYLAYVGMPSKELQTIMGHSSYRTTAEYYQVAYDGYAKTMTQYTNDIGKK